MIDSNLVKLLKIQEIVYTAFASDEAQAWAIDSIKKILNNEDIIHEVEEVKDE